MTLSRTEEIRRDPSRMTIAQQIRDYAEWCVDRDPTTIARGLRRDR